MDEEERLRLEEIRRKNAERARNDRLLAVQAMSAQMQEMPKRSGVDFFQAGERQNSINVASPDKSWFVQPNAADELTGKFAGVPEGQKRATTGWSTAAISEYVGRAKALSGDTTGYLQHLGDSALRNAPNTGAAGIAGIMEDSAVEQAMVEDPEGTIQTVLSEVIDAGQELPTPDPLQIWQDEVRDGFLGVMGNALMRGGGSLASMGLAAKGALEQLSDWTRGQENTGPNWSQQAAVRVQEGMNARFPRSESSTAISEQIAANNESRDTTAMEDAAALSEEFGPQGKAFGYALRGISQLGVDMGTLAQVAKSDPGAAAQFAAEITAENAPQIIPTIAAGAVGGLPGSLAMGTFLEVGGQLQGASTNPETGEAQSLTARSAALAVASGTLAGMLEGYGAFKVLSAAKVAGAAAGLSERAAQTLAAKLWERAKDAAGEPITEVFQTVIENEGAALGWDPDQHSFDGLLESFVGGLGLSGGGAIIGGATDIYNRNNGQTPAPNDQSTGLPTPRLPGKILKKARDVFTKANDSELAGLRLRRKDLHPDVFQALNDEIKQRTNPKPSESTSNAELAQEEVDTSESTKQAEAKSKDKVQEALRVFGTTKDPVEAGFLLPDGTMLKLFERQGSGMKNTTHDIALEKIGYKNDPDSRSDSAGQFSKDTGAIRIGPSLSSPTTGIIEAKGIPTTEQAIELGKLADTFTDIHISIGLSDGTTVDTFLNNPSSKDIRYALNDAKRQEAKTKAEPQAGQELRAKQDEGKTATTVQQNQVTADTDQIVQSALFASNGLTYKRSTEDNTELLNLEVVRFDLRKMLNRIIQKVESGETMESYLFEERFFQYSGAHGSTVLKEVVARAHETGDTSEIKSIINNSVLRLDRAESAENKQVTQEELPTPDMSGNKAGGQVEESQTSYERNNSGMPTGTTFNPDGSVTVNTLHNTEKSPAPGPDDKYLQNVEPAGRYLTEDEVPGDTPPEGWQQENKTFSNPMFMNFNSTVEGGWKRELSDKYDGKTGEELSKAVADDGFDGIITVDENGATQEIVDIGEFSVVKTARDLSNIEIMNDPNYSWPDATTKRARRTKREVAALLEKRAIATLKKAGLKPGDLNNKKNRNLIAHAIAQELVAASRSSGNAHDWYTADMAEAMEVAYTMHPELKDSPIGRIPFILSMAITSQNQSVGNNLRQAEQQYQIFKDTGRFDPAQAKGATAPAIRKNLAKANAMIQELGLETFGAILNEEFTGAELKAAGYEVSGELMSTKMHGSSIFGPKIGGGFFQNLSGNYDPLTMDMWFMRAVGRLSGKLVSGSTAEQRSRLMKAIDLDIDSGAIDWLGLTPSDTDEHGQSEFTLENIADEAVLYDFAKRIQLWHDKEFKTYRAEYDAGTRTKPETVLAAESIVKAGNPIDVPASGSERVALREIFKRSREIAKAQGVTTTNADAQALWWFPEKDLYSQLGYQNKSAEPTSYSAEMIDLARKKGIDDETIQNAADRSRRSHADRSKETGQELSRVTEKEKSHQSRIARAWLRLNVFKGFKRSRAEGETEATFFTQLRGNDGRAWVQYGSIRVRSIAGWKPGVSFSNRLNNSRADAPTMYELDTSGEGGQLYMNAIEASKQKAEYGASVYVYSAEEYSGMRLFMSKDGTSGFALKGNDIVSVFSTKEGASGAVLTMLELGMEQGGRRLDAFDTVLPDMYALHGFEVVARVPFDDSKAEEMGWDYETFKEFNGGRPDVVYMAYTANKSREYKREGKRVETSAQAEAIQAAVVEANSNTRLMETGSEYRTISGKETTLEPAKDNREVSKRRAELSKEVDKLAAEKPRKELNTQYIENRGPSRGKLLARSMSKFFKRYQRSAIIGLTAETPQDYVDLMQIYRDPRFETFRIVYVKNGVVVGHDAYSLRLPGMAASTPKTASGQTNVEFIAEAMARNDADGFFIVHNHPTENPTPSKEDGIATAQIERQYTRNDFEGQGEYLGHVVIDSGKAAFISPGISNRYFGGVPLADSDNKYLNEGHYDMMDTVSPEYGSPEMDNPVLDIVIRKTEDLMTIGKMMRDQGARVGNGSVLIIAKSSAGKTTMVMQVLESELQGARGMALLRGQAAANAGRKMYLVGATLNTLSAEMYEGLMRQGFLDDVVGIYAPVNPNANEQLFLSSLGPGREISLAQIADPSAIKAVAEMGLSLDAIPFGRFVSEEQSEYAKVRHRPDLALPGTPKGQDALNDADYFLLFDESLTESIPGWIADAEAWLAKDYDGAMKEIFYTNHGMQSPVSTIAAQMIYSKEAEKAAASGLESDWEFAVELGSRYRNGGTDAGRVLRARGADWRGDPRQALLDALARPGTRDEKIIQDTLTNNRNELDRSPAPSGAKFAAEKVTKLEGEIVKLKDQLKLAQDAQVKAGLPGSDKNIDQEISKLKKRISTLENNLRNAKDQLARANKLLDTIKEKHAARLKELYAKNARLAKRINDLLKDKGIDVTKTVTPDKARDGVTTIEGAKSSWGERIYEFYVSNILSGFLTWGANSIGNTLGTAWDFTIQQWAEVALASGQRALGIGGQDGPRAGEMVHLYKTLMTPKVWGKALLLAGEAYIKETPMVVDKMGIGTDKMDEGYQQHAIPGPFGKVVRGWGVGVLLFLDEFSKSLVYDSELVAYAYRMAKNEGQSTDPNEIAPTGDGVKKYADGSTSIATREVQYGKSDLELRMEELMDSRDSPAKHMAYDKALYLSFQNKLGKQGADTQKSLKGIPFFGNYVFTFIKTPINIAKVIARKVPLVGAVGAAWAWKQGNLKGTERVRVAEQLIGAAMFAFFTITVGGEDEEGRPYLTAAPPPGAGAREWEQRGIQGHSILIKGTYMRYDRWEPLGTVVALMVDLVHKINGASDSKTVGDLSLQAMELIYGSFMSKSMLTGVSDVMAVAESPDRLPDYIAKKIGSFAPKFIGQFGKAADPYYRDTRPKGEGLEGLTDIARKAAYQALPFEGTPFTPEPAVDIWGRERTKDYTGGQVSSFLLRLTLPVAMENSIVFRGDIWIARYNEDFPDERWFPKLPRPDFTLYRKEIVLNDNQYHEYLQIRGETAKEIFTNLLTETRNRKGEVVPPALNVNTPQRNEKDFAERAFSTASRIAKIKIAVKYFRGEQWLSQEQIDSITETNPSNPERTQLQPLRPPEER